LQLRGGGPPEGYGFVKVFKIITPDGDVTTGRPINLGELQRLKFAEF